LGFSRSAALYLSTVRRPPLTATPLFSVGVMRRRFAYEATMRRLAFLALMLIPGPTLAQDKPDGSWWATPEVRACCSVADAVWADSWQIEGDMVRATVTGGGPQSHEWAPVGREYIVPKDKWLDLPGNPTGRPMLFVNPRNLDHVFCFALGPLI